MTNIYPHWKRESFSIWTDPDRINLDIVCGFLESSYWASDIPRADLERSFATSLNYSLWDETTGKQIGFARVVTDRVRFAWLSDVFVIESYQGQGLGHWLIESITKDTRIRETRRWVLATSDAHGLYSQFGWGEVPKSVYMERKRPVT